MAKVRDLPLINTIADTDFVYFVDAAVGVNGGRRITFGNVKNLIGGSLQGVYNGSVNARIITDATRRALKVEQGPTVGGNLYEAYNDSGVLIFSVDVAGNITVAGNVDGRDIAADGLVIDANALHSALVAGNPHVVTKAEVGLGNVSNDAQIPLTEKAAINGVASLDATGRIPIAQLPSSAVTYRGAWNAASNTPPLNDATGANGDMYHVSVAGSQNLGSGLISFELGDIIIHNGSVWELIPSDNTVLSVNGQTGVVALSTDDVPEGATNRYTNTAPGQTDITNNVAVAANTTHRLVTTGNPHAVTKAEVGLSNVENIQVNLSAIVDPVVTDDSNSGYTIGSKWINTVGLACFVCIDATVGAAVWLSTTAGAGGVPNFLHIQDQKPTGTVGGAGVSLVDQTRDLNTILTNSIVDASLASNQITLPEGLYRVSATTPGVGCQMHRAILYNVTASQTLLRGKNAFTNTGGVSTEAMVDGRFSLPAGNSILELRHWLTSLSGADTLGENTNVPGEVEVYSEVLIWRLA